MDFKTLRKMSEKSLVSDFKLKIKVICVCLLIPPLAIELYYLFFSNNMLVFPVLEFGIAIWALICGVKTKGTFYFFSENKNLLIY